jgi:fatty acid desaturase
LALGFPQTVFREHHLNHHRYNNMPVAKDGVSPGDRSSLLRFSQVPGESEAFLKYAFLSPFRADLLTYAESAVRRGYGHRVAIEVSALVCLWSTLLVLDWRFALFFYVPLVHVGHVMTYAEGYFEHHKGVPGDRLKNAVSCYGRLYNLLWFNNGYHQEHHCYPQVHWTQIRAYREKMVPESERRVVPWVHWVNFDGLKA